MSEKRAQIQNELKRVSQLENQERAALLSATALVNTEFDKLFSLLNTRKTELLSQLSPQQSPILMNVRETKQTLELCSALTASMSDQVSSLTQQEKDIHLLLAHSKIHSSLVSVLDKTNTILSSPLKFSGSAILFSPALSTDIQKHGILGLPISPVLETKIDQVSIHCVWTYESPDTKLLGEPVYELQYKPKADEKWVLAYTGKDTKYTCANLSPMREYDLRVRVADMRGSSAWSVPVSCVTAQVIVPAGSFQDSKILTPEYAKQLHEWYEERDRETQFRTCEYANQWSRNERVERGDK